MTRNERAALPAWRDGVTALNTVPITPLVPDGAETFHPPPSDWQRYVTAVLRHKWLVLVITVLGTGAGAVATRFLDPRYTAKAILWIETAAQGDRTAISSEQQLLEAPGWVDLVTSNAVLDSAVRELRLYLHETSPADSAVFASFQVSERLRPGRYRLRVSGDGRDVDVTREDGGVVQRAHVGETIGSGLGFTWTPPVAALTPGRTVEFNVTTPYDAAQQLAGALRVRLEPGGNFLRLQLKGTDAARTTATLNKVADRVVAVAADLKRQKFQELATILQEQYDHAQQSLRTAEVALKDFRVRTAGAVPMGGLGVRDAGPALDARVDLDQARTDRAAIERALSQGAAAGPALEALSGLASVQHSPDLSLALQELTHKRAEVRALRTKYTEESAPVRQLNGELDVLEHQVIPSLARQLVAELTGREGQLTVRTDASVRDLRRLPPLALEEARLTRDVTSAEELFTNLRQRYEGTRLALISSLPDVRILDAAVQPQRPASDFAPVVVLLSFLLSFGLTVMGVTVMDRVDPKIRYPEQVTHQMRLTILGAVPHVSWRTGNGDGSAPVIEALRALRLRVLHAHGSDGPLLVTVSSTGVGEGKSFVSVNLALSFADAGYRTLLIDGDVRRGAQHWVLEAPRKPGLTDIAAGKSPLEAALRETSYPNLSLIAAGTRMTRAPELLLSHSMRELMARLRTSFGVIVVDSPPLAAGVDPLVLATLTGNLLLVVRSGTTDLKLASSKLEVLDTMPVRTMGAVLNDVRAGGAYRYYTYDLEGYEQVDEERQVMEGRPNILGGRT